MAAFTLDNVIVTGKLDLAQLIKLFVLRTELDCFLVMIFDAPLGRVVRKKGESA